MLSRTLPLNSSTCCGTTPIWLRRLVRFTPAMSVPSIRIWPASGLVQAHQQVGERALAGAVLADDGERLAGLDVQVEVVQRRLAAGVGEAHVAECDLAACRRKIVGQLGERLGPLGQHALQAFERAARALGLAVDIGQRADRAGEQRGVEQEGDEFGRARCCRR